MVLDLTVAHFSINKEFFLYIKTTERDMYICVYKENDDINVNSNRIV